MNREKIYIQKRIWIARLQSITFYLCRFFPIRKRKIVFCCIEGTTGYSCNPKYIAEELIKRNQKNTSKKAQYELVWLINDMSKKFPKEIKVVHNTLLNRAYHLSTARFWIDNSRKQLEVRKRKGQIYIQTWHAKLGFKPTCLDRGKSFSKIAYLVSKHDSDMVDYWLSNSDWYDKTLPTGSLYEGKTLRTGSPRCDILVNDVTEIRKKIRKDYSLPDDAMILMYAPTFRGGNQITNRSIEVSQDFPDYGRMIDSLEKRFGGTWYIFLRLHPQLVAKKMNCNIQMGLGELKERILDISKMDDMYEILAGCDAFITDYSSAAFDAAVMRIPIFLYASDYKKYEGERGSLLWNLRQLPFPLILDDREMCRIIENFDTETYQAGISKLFLETQMIEDGHAAEKVVKFLQEKMR